MTTDTIDPPVTVAPAPGPPRGRLIAVIIVAALAAAYLIVVDSTRAGLSGGRTRGHGRPRPAVRSW